ncbi:MAG: sulfofructose kinase [Hyphomicrobiales bacterium]|nr:sulfofructose kinase [Hyphomicrobiales bacterium]
MSSIEARKHVLCTGIAVLDLIFRVNTFPRPDIKTQASQFGTINGGNAANAAVAIAHLGARASFAGPLGGPPGVDSVGDTFLKLAARENIDCSTCPRVDGASSPISAICIDGRGERSIVNYRDEGLTSARPADPDALVADADAVMADNRFPEFVADVCNAAMKRKIPVVLDADEPRRDSNRLLTLVTHVIFSAEGLRATAGTDHLGRALIDVGKQTTAFLAVTDGANDVLWLDDGELRQIPAFKVEVVDTLGAGDTFHGAITLMLAEGMSERPAMRLAAATAALKCTRYGGILGAPTRAEVEAFLATRD